MDIFSRITEEEYEAIKLSFPKIAALIGTADGDMDQKEMDWAFKITKIRTFSGDEKLHDFYKEVDAVMEQKLIEEVAAYKQLKEEYVEQVANFLARLNPILTRLPLKHGAHLYGDLKSYAQHVAKASGGFMRFFSVSGAERKWVDLPMITPIIWEEEE